MIILDAQLPPALTPWIFSNFQISYYSAAFLNLSTAEDREIFFHARERNAIVITKDDDFVTLLNRHGSPPRVIWLTCGNTSKSRLMEILTANLKQSLELLEIADLVEITGR